MPYGLEWLSDNGIELLVLATLLLTASVTLLRRSAPVARNDGLPDLPQLTAGPRHLALVVMLVFFGLAGGWSLLAPLASAAIANGVVSPVGARRSIQHLEGGIIRAIHVIDGQTVVAGDPLVTLEDVRARSDHVMLRERHLRLLAEVARLEAERALAGEVRLPAELKSGKVAEPMVAVVAAQLDLFQSRMSTLKARRNVLDQRVLQLEEENAGLREAIAGQDRQIDLIEREIAGAKSLHEKGLERLPRLLELQREQQQIRIERAQNRARIARNDQAVGEARIEKASLDDDWRERAGDELANVRAELAEITSQLPKTLDALERTVVRAPLSGTIVELAFTTLSGVVRPGERILDIVPAEADLLIDARVQPQDIEDVHPGSEATVVLSAYTSRNMPKISGRVRSVSADRLVDERSGVPYYLARVEVDREQLTRFDEELALVPGMPAQVLIATGTRTFFDYLVTPLTQSFERSFREK